METAVPFFTSWDFSLYQKSWEVMVIWGAHTQGTAVFINTIHRVVSGFGPLLGISRKRNGG